MNHSEIAGDESGYCWALPGYLAGFRGQVQAAAVEVDGVKEIGDSEYY